MQENHLSAACKLTNNSGTEVAKETTVIPITILEIFNLKDKLIAAFTKKSPPITNNMNPIQLQKKYS